MLAEKPVNAAITAPEVVLIDEKGTNFGALSREQAFFLANELGLDLVAVNMNATPPIIRLMDFGKQRYEQEKRARKHRSAQRTGDIKEIKLSFRIDEHDFQTKLSQAKKFIQKGHRIKLFMRLVGRENAFAEQAKEKFLRFASSLDSTVEGIDKQGSRLSAIVK